MTHTIHTKWAEGYHFITEQNHQSIHFDATDAENVPFKGISPKMVLLSGLSGCTGMDVVAFLNKKFKILFSDFSIDVQGDLTESQPKYYNKIHIIYKIKVALGDQEKVKEAVHLSITKYCGVYAMFSKAADISHEIIFL